MYNSFYEVSQMDFNKIIEKVKNLDSIGKLSLIRWALIVLAIIMILPCELAGGVALVIFALLFWGSIIAFLTLSVIIMIKKKRAKRGKSY